MIEIRSRVEPELPGDDAHRAAARSDDGRIERERGRVVAFIDVGVVGQNIDDQDRVVVGRTRIGDGNRPVVGAGHSDGERRVRSAAAVVGHGVGELDLGLLAGGQRLISGAGVIDDLVVGDGSAAEAGRHADRIDGVRVGRVEVRIVGQNIDGDGRVLVGGVRIGVGSRIVVGAVDEEGAVAEPRSFHVAQRIDAVAPRHVVADGDIAARRVRDRVLGGGAAEHSRIGAGAASQEVIAAAAGQDVVAVAAAQAVVAAGAVDLVVAGHAVEGVGAAVADDSVDTGAADDVLDLDQRVRSDLAAGRHTRGQVDVDTRRSALVADRILALAADIGVVAEAAAADDQVVAVVAEHLIVSVAAGQGVVAAAAVQPVVAAETEQLIIAARSEQNVVAVGADDGLVQDVVDGDDERLVVAETAGIGDAHGDPMALVGLEVEPEAVLHPDLVADQLEPSAGIVQ